MTAAPAISVVVATRGRPRQLERCIAACARLTPPVGGYELVVVADGRQPAVAAACTRGRVACVVADPPVGLSAARNIGVARSRGRLLAFTDDDCRPQPGWLVGIMAALAAEPEAVVGGRIVNALPENPYSAASQLILDLLAAHHARTGDPGAAFFAGANIGLSRATFARLGGFDAGLGFAAEDRDLCARAGRLRSAPDAVVLHDRDLDLRGLWRQQHGYGQAAVALNRARAARGEPPLRVSAAFHAGLLRMLVSHPGPAPVRTRLLLGLTQAAVAYGMAGERVRGR